MTLAQMRSINLFYSEAMTLGFDAIRDPVFQSFILQVDLSGRCNDCRNTHDQTALHFHELFASVLMGTSWHSTGTDALDGLCRQTTKQHCAQYYCG